MQGIKAIETSWRGYRFRSRLEARWAVFFETLGVSWEYEKEGFEFGGQRYLPDFWIPHLKLWIEVKGELTWVKHVSESEWVHWTSEELKLARNFRDAQEWPVAVVSGTPGCERIHFFAWDVTDSSGGSYEDDDSAWCVANGVVTLDVHPGRSDRVIISDNLCGETMPWFTDPFNSGCSRNAIERAYLAARSARFEHGESPP